MEVEATIPFGETQEVQVLTPLVQATADPQDGGDKESGEKAPIKRVRRNWKNGVVLIGAALEQEFQRLTSKPVKAGGKKKGDALQELRVALKAHPIWGDGSVPGTDTIDAWLKAWSKDKREKMTHEGGSGGGDDGDTLTTPAGEPSEAQFWNRLMVDWIANEDAIAAGKDTVAKRLPAADQGEPATLEKSPEVAARGVGGAQRTAPKEQLQLMARRDVRLDNWDDANLEEDEDESTPRQGRKRGRGAGYGSRAGKGGSDLTGDGDGDGRGGGTLSQSEQLIAAFAKSNESRLAQAAADHAMADAKRAAVPAQQLAAQAQLVAIENQAKQAEASNSMLRYLMLESREADRAHQEKSREADRAHQEKAREADRAHQEKAQASSQAFMLALVSAMQPKGNLQSQ